MIQKTAGQMPVKWKTLSRFPEEIIGTALTSNINHLKILRYNPFGSFCGIRIVLTPNFRTRPLELRDISEKHPGNAVTGLAKTKTETP